VAKAQQNTSAGEHTHQIGIEEVDPPPAVEQRLRNGRERHRQPLLRRDLLLPATQPPLLSGNYRLIFKPAFLFLHHLRHHLLILCPTCFRVLSLGLSIITSTLFTKKLLQ